MATTAAETPLSYLAGADLSAKQFCFVKESTAADKTVLLAGVGDIAIGVVGNKPASGQAALVDVMGRLKVIYGGTVTRGDPLTPDANGHAITQTGSSPVVAYAEESGASGEIHSILMVARPASAGVAGSTVSIPVSLASIATGVIARFTPGYAGAIKKTTYVPSVVSTTAAKAATLTPNIAGAPVTGGVLALTSANTGTLATNVNGTAVTAANTFGAADELTLVASAVTAFVEGSGVILIELQ